MFSFHRKTLPCAISGAHVFDIVSALSDADRRVNIAQMLVILEMDEIIGFPSDSHLSLTWDLDNRSMCWSFYDSEGEYSTTNASLELIASHLDDHILHYSLST